MTWCWWYTASFKSSIVHQYVNWPQLEPSYMSGSFSKGIRNMPECIHKGIIRADISWEMNANVLFHNVEERGKKNPRIKLLIRICLNIYWPCSIPPPSFVKIGPEVFLYNPADRQTNKPRTQPPLKGSWKAKLDHHVKSPYLSRQIKGPVQGLCWHLLQPTVRPFPSVW